MYESGLARWTLDPSDPANAPYLAASTTYTVTLKGGANGPLAANGVSRLPLDYSFTFRTSSAQLVLDVTPAEGATDVASSGAVCVDFVASVDASTLTAGGNQLVLTWTDAFGRSAPVPLDGAVPYTVSDSLGNTGNRVCMNVLSGPYACGPGQFRLRPGTAFTATLGTSVKVGSSFPAQPFSWSFTTRAPPALSGMRVANAVVAEPLVDGATEVPINGAFTVTFAEPMAAASLTAANLHVVNLATGAVVATTVTPDGLAAPLAVTLTTGGLSHAGAYAVELLAGEAGVTSAAGQALEADVRVKFTTSPVTTLGLSPPEANVTPTVLIPLVSDRPLYLPSATSENIYGTCTGTRIGGIVALQVSQPRAATYIANPTWVNGSSCTYDVRTTTGLLDYRGNPVPAVTSKTYGTANAPSTSASLPTALAAGNVTQPSNSQSFEVAMGGTGLKERILTTSYYSLPVASALTGTVSLAAAAGGGAGCPAAGTKLQLETVLVPGATTGVADKVSARVASAPYMKSGCPYTLTVKQSQESNLYGQQPGNGSYAADVTFSATGESTAPTLAALEIQKVDGTFAALSGSSTASGATVVRASFSETVDASTVTTSSFAVTASAVPLPGTFAVNGAVVTWTASSKLPAGTNVTVQLTGGLKDLAGNAFAGVTQSFSVESATPSFTAVSWDATTSRSAPYGTATLTFSEPVDPSTLSCNTQGVTGSVSLSVASVPLYGCAVQSGTNANQVLWRPADALTPGAVVDVTVNAAGAGSVLKDNAQAAVPLTTRSFTP